MPDGATPKRTGAFVFGKRGAQRWGTILPMPYTCPTCSAPLAEESFGHCPACGQRLIRPKSSPQAWVAPQKLPPFAASAHQGVREEAHALAKASASLGALSLMLPPFCLVAIPLGLTSLSAIAQGKHPRAGTWPSTAGVLMGMGGYFLVLATLQLFALIF